ncbi:MAG: glycoside hydrolase family 88 protein [Bacteroidetes bacterium]|nr:glycoside hydrolase family 88 protein [Bacteroidota bacterium]
MNRLYILFVLLLSTGVMGQTDERTPLQVAKSIGDKLVKETPFNYKLTLAKPNHLFNDIQVIDFARSITTTPAVAYAYTCLNVKEDRVFNMQLDHNDGCKIWLNGRLVYEKNGNRNISLKHLERSVELKEEISLSLNKGNNTILIKSETRGKEWKVFMQPPSQKGAIINENQGYPEIGLLHAINVDKEVADLTNWIVIGPFENNIVAGKRMGMSAVYAPEKAIEFGKMYKGLNGLITWSILKSDILGDVINAKEWGTNYNWNYHNGGVAWAMEQLSEISGNTYYEKYAEDFCNFHLLGKPFVSYQVNTLNAFNSANSLFLNTPLLDFTLAPSLPIIYKLRKDTAIFQNKASYETFIQNMMVYAKEKQLRLPGSLIFTRNTPVKYTTWVDDMFMGIPFLVQASLLQKNPIAKKQFMDDAVNQIIGFNKEVFDTTANLYVHAKYSTSNEKLPHWSRANGWGVWSTTEVLMNLSKKDARYPIVLEYYKKHITALAALQDKSGFWLNVLDVKDSPKEVSGTAIFVMAMARGIRNGWIDEKVYLPIVMKGWEALKKEIEIDGTVHNICMGTMCSSDVNYYNTRPFYDNDTHGLFAVLFACIELDKLSKNKQ